MALKKFFCGEGRDKMPNMAFRIMSFIFKIRDKFFPVGERLNGIGIQKGFTIIDYGCGTGSYLKKASELVGEAGKVYAVDVHKLAIESVEKKMGKYNLKNIKPVMADGYCCDIQDSAADMIYALDMFHMIKEPEVFLKELRRLLKKDGFLIIENGHQSRDEAKEKINKSGIWKITEEKKDYLKCVPA